MPKQLGRKVILKIDNTPIAGLQTKGFTINNTIIDITDDYDQGLQTMLAEPGLKAVEISGNGVCDTTALLDLSLSNNVSASMTFDFGAYTVSGTFMVSSYGESMEHATARTFTASFSSSGAVVKSA